ncbi:preprotein translocase subunit YajC [Clostridium polynesiense]|uniref:preprotein translocase subunit YajC n=1 Tax=Clostridium polynesiense TaxID=1325933 RepID=UPI00058BDF9E|nr:preprotein translocase subunit YajC [Clostridium polynesiense]
MKIFLILIALCVIVTGIEYLFKYRRIKNTKDKIIQLQNQIKIGDNILLGPGIYGQVLNIHDKTAVIKVSEGVEITVDRFSIVKLV